MRSPIQSNRLTCTKIWNANQPSSSTTAITEAIRNQRAIFDVYWEISGVKFCAADLACSPNISAARSASGARRHPHLVDDRLGVLPVERAHR